MRPHIQLIPAWAELAFRCVLNSCLLLFQGGIHCIFILRIIFFLTACDSNLLQWQTMYTRGFGVGDNLHRRQSALLSLLMFYHMDGGEHTPMDR